MCRPLLSALEKALYQRQQASVPTTDLYDQTPRCAPDFFSNDYLSLCTDDKFRALFMEKVSQQPVIFGSSGSRLITGNTPAHLEFEDRMKTFFRAPAALLFNSGYDANIAFWHSVPQPTDAVIFDELVHASTRHGSLASRAANALYSFTHNSITSLRDVIGVVLKKHTAISEGKGTLFIAVESLYSMDGDFAPLLEIVQAAEELVPKGCCHILVDEAHSTGIFGECGRGVIAALGLENRIDSVLHTFGKGRGLTGAVLLTSPTVRKYVINYGRPFIFSTSPSHLLVCALNASFDYIEGSAGAELKTSLYHISKLFEQKLRLALKEVPPYLLSLHGRATPAGFPSDIISPIFPVFTGAPILLADYLRSLGYGARPVPYPVVPHGQERVRIVVHARNTEGELDQFIEHLLSWVKIMEEKGIAVNKAGQALLITADSAMAEMQETGPALEVDWSVSVGA